MVRTSLQSSHNNHNTRRNVNVPIIAGSCCPVAESAIVPVVSLTWFQFSVSSTVTAAQRR